VKGRKGVYPLSGDDDTERPDATLAADTPKDKAPGRVRSMKRVHAGQKLKREEYRRLPDTQEALQAVGLCGRKNRTYRVKWTDPETGQKRFKTFLHEADCVRHFESVTLAIDPGAEMDRAVEYEYCHRRPLKSSQRRNRVDNRHQPACQFHGGAAPFGPAAAKWGKGKQVAGKYSRILGGNYLAAYEASLKSGDVPNLREQIALVEAREDALVRMVEAKRREMGDAPAAWRQAAVLVKKCRRELDVPHMRLLLSSGSMDGFLSPFEDLEKLLVLGGETDALWDDLLRNVIPSKRKLVEVQNRMTSTSEEFVPVEETLATAARMVDLVRKCFGLHANMKLFVTELQAILLGANYLDKAGVIDMSAIPDEEEGDDGEGVM